MKIKEFREKFWIRKDREESLISGFMISIVLASITTTYWHFQDMTELKPKIKLNTQIKKEKLYKQISENENMLPSIKEGTTVFYKVETYIKPELGDKNE